MHPQACGRSHALFQPVPFCGTAWAARPEQTWLGWPGAGVWADLCCLTCLTYLPDSLS
ncbi:protein of unknown function [Paraburkholderia dioscoreae]|uniref:Uncharacterized protein n=1 Tax=Paraburkholderia dioscoreae TaxID=2604047 RepID=A0A5Q4ZUG7_9BURK|nr:protein of unknown function [Paraburkholderia dioscoreae]